MRLNLVTVLIVTGVTCAGGYAMRTASAVEEGATSFARTFVTQHSVMIDGVSVNYTATVGETVTVGENGEPNASFISTAYIRSGVKDLAARPITFLFNGGPGTSSIYVHLGGFGPRRIALPSDLSNVGGAPYKLVDNHYSVLDATDLVFIDPIGTGFSHALGRAADRDFWGVSSDGRSVAAFIRAWISQNGRWNSPKYIGGESYGGTRIAKVLASLESSSAPVTFNGVLLISAPLDYVSFVPALGDDKAYPLLLPTMAATAWYHNKVSKNGRSFEQFLEEAREFAKGEYSAALFEGGALGGERRQQIAARLESFTGIPAPVFFINDLRLRGSVFATELMRPEGLRVGRQDGRYTGSIAVNSDPSSTAVGAAFTTGINEYLRTELGVHSTAVYNVGIHGDWTWDIAPSATDQVPGVYLNLVPQIVDSMQRNANLRVFVATGYYDLLVPFFSMEYTAAHLPDASRRVTVEHYEAGHMMYTHEPSLEKLAADVRRFIASASR